MHPEPLQGSQGPWQQCSPTGAAAPPVVPGGRLPAPERCRCPWGCRACCRGHRQQQQRLVAGTHTIINLLFSPPFRNLQTKLIHKLQPGVSCYK